MGCLLRLLDLARLPSFLMSWSLWLLLLALFLVLLVAHPHQAMEKCWLHPATPAMLLLLLWSAEELPDWVLLRPQGHASAAAAAAAAVLLLVVASLRWQRGVAVADAAAAAVVAVVWVLQHELHLGNSC